MTPAPSTPPAAARSAHAESVARFVAACRVVPDDRWDGPLAPGKWSPAETAEHLRLTYEVVNRELAGGTGIRIRTSWWARWLLRLRVLPAILATGRIPAGARAPSEVRPGAGPFPRAAVLAGLEALAARAEAVLAERAPDAPQVMTHHVFGRLTAGQALRFLTVHNEHHAAQLRP